MTETHLGFDAGHGSCSELEHLLARAAELVDDVQLVCTHVVDGHYAGSLLTGAAAPTAAALAGELGCAVAVLGDGGAADDRAGDDAWRSGAERAAAELRGRTGGRAVVFAGQDALVGELDTDEVTTLSAVEQVVGVAGTPTAGTRLRTQDFVRPVLREGALVLQVRPFGADGTVAPFEVPNPTPCCVIHA